MFCKNCGTQLPDNAQFCSHCGTAQEVAFTAQQPPQPVFQQDPYAAQMEAQREEEKDRMAGDVLKWGILGLAFAISGLLSLLGFIFSIIAKNKASEYTRLYGQVEGRAKVGRDLGTAGFIVGLILTIFFTIYFVLIIGILGSL